MHAKACMSSFLDTRNASHFGRTVGRSVGQCNATALAEATEVGWQEHSPPPPSSMCMKHNEHGKQTTGEYQVDVRCVLQLGCDKGGEFFWFLGSGTAIQKRFFCLNKLLHTLLFWPVEFNWIICNILWLCNGKYWVMFWYNKLCLGKDFESFN